MSSELVSLVDDEEAESGASPSAEPLGPGSTPSAAPPVQHSPRCPAGMLEVDGLYCKNLLHRCINGGKDYKGEPSPDPEPYYCDEFAMGAAKCFSPEEKKHFCIDEYEYPNRKGAIPRVMVSWYEAKRLCEELGKRLCGDDEWNLACEGPARLPYVYGWKRDRSACNIDKRWLKPNDGILANKGVSPERLQEELDRLSKRVPSGSMPRCKSPYGVMDMGGNVDEWTVNVTWKGKPHKSLLKGGHWMGGARNRCRPVTARHDETTSYYAQGFRCCADPTMTEQALPAT
jgi:sulfatase modifying factor 1